MSPHLPPHLSRHGRIAFERALPLFAGTALAVAGGGELTVFLGLALLAILVLATLCGETSRSASIDGVFFGLVPVLLAHALVSGSMAAWGDPLVWSIAAPLAIYAANPALVSLSRTGSPTLFALLNALALAALALPVITGRIHWAIAILPFAAFRVAATTADKLRPGANFALDRQEATEVARKILWLSGAWIAGWAGVTP